MRKLGRIGVRVLGRRRTLRLMVNPVVVGSGRRLVEEGVDRRALELVDSKVFSTGVVYLSYRLVHS